MKGSIIQNLLKLCSFLLLFFNDCTDFIFSVQRKRFYGGCVQALEKQERYSFRYKTLLVNYWYGISCLGCHYTFCELPALQV